MRRVLLLALVSILSPGCLVLSLHPAYDEDSLGWDAGLVGAWIDADDNASILIERGEWRSYKIHYVHPIETGDLTGYLTIVGDERYLDVMPARGEDRGAFMIPVHGVLRVRLEADTLELTPLSYDWFFDRIRAHTPIPGLSVTFDQKENALISSTSAQFRNWLRLQPPTASAFGASATFTRKPPG